MSWWRDMLDRWLHPPRPSPPNRGMDDLTRIEQKIALTSLAKEQAETTVRVVRDLADEAEERDPELRAVISQAEQTARDKTQELSVLDIQKRMILRAQRHADAS